VEHQDQGFYIGTAKRLYAFYEARNGAQDLTKGLKLKRQTPPSRDRKEHSLELYRLLFANAATYRRREPHKWWVTVACAFLGCRLEEVAQAHLDGDFTKDEGNNIWYLKIEEGEADSAGGKPVSPKSVKSLTGWRRVPLHPALIGAGFINYLELNDRRAP
jgi:hypothetical protein